MHFKYLNLSNMDENICVMHVSNKIHQYFVTLIDEIYCRTFYMLKYRALPTVKIICKYFKVIAMA